MSNPESREFYTERPPLLKLEADLTWVESYSSLTMSFHEYLANELEMSGKEAGHFISMAIMDKKLPDESLYDADRQSAHNLLRIQFYRSVIPLYESTHSSEELDEWLPGAMRLAVNPDSDEHTPATCFKPSATEEVCARGICSLKAIECDVVASLQYPDFSELEYAIDPNKQAKDTLRRLDSAVQYGIIGHADSTRLSGDYLNRFNMCFPMMP